MGNEDMNMIEYEDFCVSVDMQIFICRYADCIILDDANSGDYFPLVKVSRLVHL